MENTAHIKSISNLPEETSLAQILNSMKFPFSCMDTLCCLNSWWGENTDMTVKRKIK